MSRKDDDPQYELPFGRPRDDAPAPAPPPHRVQPRRPSRERPRPEVPAPPAEEPEVFSVARLDRVIKRVIEGATADVRVRGEVSGLRRAGSGHMYFSLKDEREDALIDCVMYRTAPARARRALENGERVVLAGRATLYAPRGRIQFIAEDVLASGRGALLVALERLKRKLAAEGLFDPERKKPLPAEPRTVAVLTSRDGAAIHDVCRVAFRRGGLRILLVNTPVQGPGAAERIAAAIAYVDRLRSLDAMIVTRGGGSAEDLMAYNDELVVRAIAAARTPVISAVGHEIDVTLADLAADRRAATPSQAAEMLVPDQGERRAALDHFRRRLLRATEHRLVQGRERLARLERRLGEPRRRLLEQSQRFDELEARLERAIGRQLSERRGGVARAVRRLEAHHPQRVLAAARLTLSPLGPRMAAAMRRRLGAMRRALERSSAQLEALSPLAVLGRGYAIATREDGGVVMDARSVSPGEVLRVRLHRGALAARVVEREGPPEVSGEG